MNTIETLECRRLFAFTVNMVAEPDGNVIQVQIQPLAGSDQTATGVFEFRDGTSGEQFVRVQDNQGITLTQDLSLTGIVRVEVYGSEVADEVFTATETRHFELFLGNGEDFVIINDPSDALPGGRTSAYGQNQDDTFQIASYNENTEVFGGNGKDTLLLFDNGFSGTFDGGNGKDIVTVF